MRQALYKAEFIKKPRALYVKAKSKIQKKKKKSTKARLKKPRKISEKYIEKNFLNLANYQEIDRLFLDSTKNYQHAQWEKKDEKYLFPNPPKKISVNLVKNFQDFAVNDLIAARLMLHPPKGKEFSRDFDFKIDAKSKKIGAYGFVIGEAKILRKADISSFDEWFLFLRQKIKAKISAVLIDDEKAIALAFLIGDQNQISKDLMAKIRNCGLAHLLSISGFHLALAGTIFFAATRFILSRSEYLALNFDLKKIAAILALFATYFYLQLAASPLPAQRAFVMILFAFGALVAGEKLNSKRSVIFAAFALILLNPYALFNISFQLSFAAVMVLVAYYEYKKNLLEKKYSHHFLSRFFAYFLDIIFLSVLIQIATLPFLMHSFQSVALLGLTANIIAIPLTSFFIMPLGFGALFLMPFSLEKPILFLMGKGIFLLEKITIFIASINYSHLTSPQLPSVAVVIAAIGLLMICFHKNEIRYAGIIIFLLSFLTIFTDKKPAFLFEKNQKFFAIYSEKDGLIFSRNLKPSKQRQSWMKAMDEHNFQSLENFSDQWKKQQGIFCDKKKYFIEKEKKILVLIGRNKISEICENNFDVIVNLTAKYALPACIAASKIKIDNLDFYKKGAHFFYLEKGKLRIETIS